MIVLAIDPGSERSGWVKYDTSGRVLEHGKDLNPEVLEQLIVNLDDGATVVIEWMTPRGMLSSAQEFEALWWAGRFTQAALSRGIPVVRLAREDIKRHLIGATRQKGGPNADARVRAALIDRFGGIGGKEAAIGRKASPGPLYGVTADCWAALAVAVTFADAPSLAHP